MDPNSFSSFNINHVIKKPLMVKKNRTPSNPSNALETTRLNCSGIPGVNVVCDPRTSKILMALHPLNEGSCLISFTKIKCG